MDGLILIQIVGPRLLLASVAEQASLSLTCSYTSESRSSHVGTLYARYANEFKLERNK